MNPELTLTLPDYQTESGCADIMMHTMERYFTSKGNMELTDAIAEALLRTVIKNAQILHKDPGNYDARAEIMWAGSLAHNDLTGCGNGGGDFVTHELEHEMGGMFDVTHGAGLAVITPHWMRYTLNAETAPKFAQLGVNVFGLDPKAGVEANARKAIECTAEFFASIGLPRTLAELKVTDEHSEEMAEHVEKFWYPLANAFRPSDRAGVLEILRASL